MTDIDHRFPAKWWHYTLPKSLDQGANAACIVVQETVAGEPGPRVVDATVGVSDGKAMVRKHNEGLGDE